MAKRKPRKERVEIQCPIRIGTAVKNKELPFKMLVMAPLSGQERPKISRPQLISKDSANDISSVMKKVKPKIRLSVENRVSGASAEAPGTQNLELTIADMQDFSPQGVERQLAEQMSDFKAKLDLLRKLERFSSQINLNIDFDNLDRDLADPDLRDVLSRIL